MGVGVFFAKYHTAHLKCIHRLSKNTGFVPEESDKTTEIKCKSFSLFENVCSFSFLNQVLSRTY